MVSDHQMVSRQNSKVEMKLIKAEDEFSMADIRGKGLYAAD